jgi:hypothetical protein
VAKVRLVRFFVNLALLPVRLAVALVSGTLRATWGLLSGTFKVGLAVGSVPGRASRRVGRLLGLRALLALLLGVAVGLLLAPGPGRELRARLKALADQRRGTTDDDLAERVVFELGHAPRTWHLPQPSVSVIDGRVVLTGRVDQETARDELGRVAAALPGIVGVENLIAVDGDEAGAD